MRVGVPAAASSTAARSSLLPGLAIDDSLSSTSLLVGEEDLVLDMRGFKKPSDALVGYFDVHYPLQQLIKASVGIYGSVGKVLD